MKAFYLFLSIIVPLTVGAQNTNSEKLQQEQPLNLNQLHKEFKDQQRERIKELKPKAERGDAAAQCELGQLLLYQETFEPPKPVEPNPEGIKWLRKAAEQGSLQAQLDLANLLRFSPDTETEAVKWLRAAADQGAAQAQYDLGVCYEQGEIVPKDYPEAAKLYLQAAEQGHQFAQTRLVELYSEGKGVPRSLKEAYVWNFISNVCGGSRLLRETEILSLPQKNEEKLSGDELEDAQKEAMRRLVEIAEKINATGTAN